MYVMNRVIEPFQHGETPTFIEHVKAGVSLLQRDSEGLLVFSGYVPYLSTMHRVWVCPSGRRGLMLTDE